MIVFFAALVSILYYLGIMQRVVRWVGGAIGWVTGISRVESLGAAANIFVGQSESPLVVRPYLAALSPSALFTLMTVGMAGVAGTILAAYAGLLGASYLPFLLAASFMSAPGGILMAKIIMPDEVDPAPEPEGEIVLPEAGASAPRGRRRWSRAGDAAKSRSPKPSRKATSPPTSSKPRRRARRPGSSWRWRWARWCSPSWRWWRLPMACSAAMGGLVRLSDQLSFQMLFGYVFAPVMYLLGIPWDQAITAGGLFGTKIVLNEFVAFIDLGKLTGAALTDRSRAMWSPLRCAVSPISVPSPSRWR